MRSRANAILDGVVLGGAAGGLATGVEAYLIIVVFGWVGATSPPSPVAVFEAAILGLPLIPVAAVIAGLAFMAGLVIVGLPAWAALHALRLRSRGIAAVAGSVLAPASVWAGGPWDVTASNFSWLPLGLVLPGAIAGWTLHRARCLRPVETGQNATADAAFPPRIISPLPTLDSPFPTPVAGNHPSSLALAVK